MRRHPFERVNIAREPKPQPVNVAGGVRQGWATVGGKRCYFRSTWEYNYSLYLQWLKDNKHILDWFHEPHTFIFPGVTRGVTNYKPDFKVIELPGYHRWHEVKGYMRREDQVKLNRMRKYFPEEQIIMIDRAQMRSIASKIGPMLRGWVSGG